MEDTTLVLAESTVGVELAGEAEKAITAKPEALEPGVYNEAGRRREGETPRQEAERRPEVLPQGAGAIWGTAAEELHA